MAASEWISWSGRRDATMRHTAKFCSRNCCSQKPHIILALPHSAETNCTSGDDKELVVDEEEEEETIYVEIYT